MEYTIHFRTFRPGGGVALIVEGDDGMAYLLSGGTLQCGIRGVHPAARLQALLAGVAAWHPVPVVSPYTLPELRALLEPQHTVAHAA